ncbi:hypothetical protein MLD38_022420 [Melastoma candidum]|uniref:Uncharacterized protein n=1 Tax=Melastoma candidum TaxID=119954 RepID=A0ACB9QID5_9MYRT|nr:hypothetical protein MLD38_022420 [Melastoma candidum]
MGMCPYNADFTERELHAHQKRLLFSFSNPKRTKAICKKRSYAFKLPTVRTRNTLSHSSLGSLVGARSYHLFPAILPLSCDNDPSCNVTFLPPPSSSARCAFVRSSPGTSGTLSTGSRIRNGASSRDGRREAFPAQVYGRQAQEWVLEEEVSPLTERRFKDFPGQAFPVGVSEVDNGVSFAIFLQNATSVTLWLSLPQSGTISNTDDELLELPLDPYENKTGDIWHLSIEGLPRSNVLYGYRMDGPQEWHEGHRFHSRIVLIDPYAKLIEGRCIFGDATQKTTRFMGTYDLDTAPFDWGEEYKLPDIPEEDLIIYEMNVRAFTVNESSGLDPQLHGSYLGLIQKVNKRKPYRSINFVIAHDGFSLYDLVSYNTKHNEANGEGDNDGSNDNYSWNCGVEGETDNVEVMSLRARQMKNFHLVLMIAKNLLFHHGTPMMLMGDEYGHTRYGNNNSCGHDTSINHFLWTQLDAKRKSHFKFFSEVIRFRKSHALLRNPNFLEKKDVTRHEDIWENSDGKFLAFTLHESDGGDIYTAFNAHNYFVKVPIPPPPKNRLWHRVVDTNLESPNDIVLEGVPGVRGTYNVAPYSSILLLAKA